MHNAAELDRRYRRIAIYTTVAIYAVVAISVSLGLFNWLDAMFYDLHFKMRGFRQPSGQVVLVYMDENSASRLQRHQGTWSRRNMALALNNLTAAGSEIIGLDMIFFAPANDPQHDIELASAIDRSNNVVLARIAAVPGQSAIEPLQILRYGMIGDGFIDLPLDRDNYLRKVRFLTATPLSDGSLQLVPAFSLEIARTFRNLDFQFDFSHPDHFTLGSKEQRQLKLPYPELLINYYGTDSVFQQINYADVVTNQFDPQLVAGKIVLIGSRLKTEKDLFNTPFTRYHSLHSSANHKFAKNITSIQVAKEPGLSCHAHAIETILNQSFIIPLQEPKFLLLLLLVAIIGHPLILSRRKTAHTLLYSSLLLSMTLLLSQSSFQHGLWIKIPAILTIIIGQFLASVALLKIHEKQRSQWLTSVFGKYVSETVVKQLVQGDINPNMEGQSQELTILFADLRSFTSISEHLTPQQTTQLLNTFFGEMIPQIQRQHGTVDKLIGDAIMAVFGAPISYDDHAQRGAEAALNMLSALKKLQHEQQLPGLEQLKIGIGLNSGEVTIGNLGCKEFMNYTAIGDNVNLASRLEGLNKIYGSSILLSQQTAQQLDSSVFLRELDWVTVKGKDNITVLYELVGFRAQLNEDQLELMEKFAQGLTLYRKRNWDAAQKCFEQALKLKNDDGPSALFLQRCTQLRNNPPSEEWDAITRFKRK
ncbi:MAG: hypothetical protein B6I36_09700 [Desulfobacteraceae bacterium 4572_35.1]|nr:MAG: hypothetical protein B6I36_09700 [Desulfobacteraceae bacterium 4572_35.1]